MPQRCNGGLSHFDVLSGVAHSQYRGLLSAYTAQLVENLLLVSYQENSNAVLLSGKKRPLNYCLGSMIPPHGVNSNIHDEALESLSGRGTKGITKRRES